MTMMKVAKSHSTGRIVAGQCDIEVEVPYKEEKIEQVDVAVMEDVVVLKDEWVDGDLVARPSVEQQEKIVKQDQVVLIDKVLKKTHVITEEIMRHNISLTPIPLDDIFFVDMTKEDFDAAMATQFADDMTKPEPKSMAERVAELERKMEKP